MDLVAAVRQGRAKVEWADLVSEVNGHKLTMRIFRDAMKVGGVREPATAYHMQEVADLTFCMLPTPKILDLVWLQATTRFNPVVNHNKVIVAEMDVKLVSSLVDAKIAEAGDKGGLIASVGKYWVLTNQLRSSGLLFGYRTACNYGWHSTDSSGMAVTARLRVWQSQGFRHNDLHVDPSQVVRLVSRNAKLLRAGASEEVEVDLHDIAKDKELSKLICHDGPLLYLRQAAVPEPKAVQNTWDGSVTLPEIVFL